MTLEEIKSKLYKRETDDGLLRHQASEFDARSELTDPSNEQFTETNDWEEKRGLEGYQKRAIAIGIFVVVLIFLFSAGIFSYYKYNQGAFSEKNVTLTIEGPTEIESGKELNFSIKYANNNRVSLGEAEIKVYFPENFQAGESPGLILENSGIGRFKLGEIKGQAEGEVSFHGKAFNPKGSLIYLKSDFSYKPANFNSQFVLKDQLNINVAYSPLALQVLAPENLANGDTINYAVSYKNESADSFQNVEIKIELPQGFTLSGATPTFPENDNIWKIGNLSPGQSGKIIIYGKLEGSKDDVRVIRAEIGSLEKDQFVIYNRENLSTRIDASPISISQTVNGEKEFKANPGENLSFAITYKNEGNIDLGNVMVTEKIDSPLFDYSTMQLSDGSYNASSKTITWKASDHKELMNLEPGAGGKIIFNIRIINNIPPATPDRKNLVLSGIAKIDSPDVPTPVESNKIIASNTVNVSIKTKISLQAEGYYNDPVIKNFGPIPPVSGQETSYTIHWKLFNVYNDLKDARIEAVIPTGAVMTGSKIPADADLTYNERNNNLIWNVGNVTAGTGFTSPPKELIFQIKIKPGPDQIKKAVNLVGPVTFSGKDSFTGVDLSVKAVGKTTELKEDISLPPLGGIVSP
jgi:hypothetical protein